MKRNYKGNKGETDKERYIYLILFILDAIKDIKKVDEVYRYAQSLWMSETKSEKEAEDAPNPGG